MSGTSEARKSINRPVIQELLDNLIYNYSPTYGGKAGYAHNVFKSLTSICCTCEVTDDNVFMLLVGKDLMKFIYLLKPNAGKYFVCTVIITKKDVFTTKYHYCDAE